MTISPPDAHTLPRIAPMMAAIAAETCSPECRAYHAIWGYLRLYGTLPAAGRDHDVLLSTLREQVRAGCRRILISGSADAGILAYVIATFRAEGVTGSPTVVDQCPTPLAVNLWYGQEAGCPVETWCGSIQAFAGTGFDLVVSHNFLNLIAPQERVHVCNVWRRALKPGGRTVLITKTRPGQAELGRRFNPEQVVRLRDDLLAAHKASPHRNLIPPDDLACLATDFAERRVTRHFAERRDIIAPIEAAGLRVLACDDIEPSLGASAAARPGQRIRVIAERAK